MTATSVEASFLRDVVHAAERRSKFEAESNLQESLLKLALPIEEYRANLKARGYDVHPIESRQLDQNEEADADDYYLDASEKYSFSGYSLKYAKCQPVQRFSEDAMKAGEYSPMITDDIVILRLCPYRFCSTSKQFGCNYNYAEYAIDLSDYIRVMIRYTEDRKQQLCNWCDSCYSRRRLDQEDYQENDAAGDDAANQNENEQQANDDNQQDNQQDNNGNDDASKNSYGDSSNYYDETDPCYDYQTYCSDSSGNKICSQSNDDTYLSVDEYLNYLDCAKISDQEHYSYYVRPRCDGSKGTIKMAVFHDQFCSQYAGNEVSLKNFGIGFKESVFEEFYDTSACMDCSESVSKPITLSCL